MIFLEIWTKTDFCKVFSKKLNSPWNVKFSEIKRAKNNFYYSSKIWWFFILIFDFCWYFRQNTIFKGDLNKKHSFPGNINIVRYMGKIRLFQSDFKMTCFSPKCWYLQRYSQKKTTFSKWFQKIIGLIEISKFSAIWAP